ncbi:MAG: carbohydrate ABC transporter permease [Treponema sp.]|nr:carbohydrate ABC transporter permease [Treponema sp.]
MAIRQSRGDIVFTIINYAFLFAASSLVLYPLVYIVSSSFSSIYAVASGRVWLFPVQPSLQGYKAVFADHRIWTGYLNSLFYASAGTAISVTMTVLAAYPLSRRDFVGRNVIMLMFTFTILFSGGLIPSYLLVRSLGMDNTRFALIIPGAVSVWSVIITRTFFQSTIPNELLEASQIDGCDNITFLYKVVLPLSLPVLAVITLQSVVGHWNAYFNALLYLKNEKLYPLQIILRNILIQNQIATENLDADVKNQIQDLRDLLKYSLIVVASVPVLAIYPFVQKYFIKGVMIGAIKG